MKSQRYFISNPEIIYYFEKKKKKRLKLNL